MKSTTDNILPTRNKSWGLWGTSGVNGLDPQETWTACMRFFMDRYGLEADDARNLLDDRFGRHLADQLASGRDLEWVAVNWAPDVLRTIRSVKENREAYDASADED